MLKRSMRVLGALLLTLSVVTPASSVYVIVPGILQQAGTGAFIAMAIGALIGLALAFIYAELASAFPIAGAEYSMLGRAIGPWAGFVMLGINGVNTTMGMSALAVGASSYLDAFITGLDPQIFGMSICLVATALSILNIRTNAWITGLFLLTEIITLIVLGCLGILHTERAASDLLFHPMMVNDGQLQPATLTAIGLGITISAFAYNGFGSAVSFAEEMHEAPTLVARTILWAFGLTVALEILPVTAVLLGAPDLAAILGSTNPFNDFVRLTGGETVDQILGLSIALAIGNAVLATILVNARFFYSTGRDNVWWPSANRALVQVHDRFHSPWVATLISGGAAAAACFIPFPMLLVFSGTGIVVVYGMLSIGVLTGRRSGRTDHAPYRMPGHPVIALFALAAVIYVGIANWQDTEVGRPGLIFIAAVMAVSASYYFLIVRRRGDWVLHGPEVETKPPV